MVVPKNAENGIYPTGKCCYGSPISTGLRGDELGGNELDLPVPVRLPNGSMLLEKSSDCTGRLWSWDHARGEAVPTAWRKK
jgi:hypothetical protein